MKAFTLKGLALLVLTCLQIHVLQVSASTDEFYDFIAKLRAKIEQDKVLLCPGLNTTLNCGNNQCEADRGEDQNSCPADCGKGLIRSYNKQTICQNVQKIFKPSTTEDVQKIVKEAVQAGQKIRVGGRAHSANSQICTTGIIISSERLNKIIALENYNGVETVLLQAGVPMWKAADWLHERNRTLGYTYLGFRGATVAGAAATGSHGSSPNHTAVISSLIESLTVVSAQGEIREFSKGSTDPETWKALKASLGMLGVITQMRLRVEPQFNLRVEVSYEPDQILFKDQGVFEAVAGCDYGQINWFPSSQKFMKTCGRQTTEPADQGAENVLVDPQVSPRLVDPFKLAMQYGACHPWVMCAVEKFRYLDFVRNPPFIKTSSDGKETAVAFKLVGPSHKVTSSNMSGHITGFFEMDWELAVPKSKAQAALEAVRAHLRDHKVCLPLVGVFIRFAPVEESTLLAHTAAGGEFKIGEPAMIIELPVFIPNGFNAADAEAYMKPYEEFARLLVEKFGARAHWGKNRDWVFQLEKRVGTFGNNFCNFRKSLIS